MSEENYEEIKAKNFRFGAIGDYFKGTLLDVSKTQSLDKYGKLSYIYKFKAVEGSFYDSTKNEKTGKSEINKEPTVLQSGQEFVFFVSTDKGVLVGAMKDVKIGQKFMARFIELKPTTRGEDAKIIKVYAGKNAEGKPLMDESWVEANKEEVAAAPQTDEQAAAFDGK